MRNRRYCGKYAKSNGRRIIASMPKAIDKIKAARLKEKKQ